MTLVALLFAATSNAFARFGAVGTKTFKLDFENSQANIANNRLGTIRFGYWGYCALGTCQDYKFDGESVVSYNDAFLLTGVSTAFCMAAFGGMYLIFLLMTMCVRMKKWLLVTVGLVFGLCLSLPALSLLIAGIGLGSSDCFNNFDDDQIFMANFTWDPTTDKLYYCRPDIGSILAFTSFILWIVALSVTCCCMSAEPPRSHDQMHYPPAEEAGAYSTYTHTPSKNGDAASQAPSYAASTGLEETSKAATP